MADGARGDPGLKYLTHRDFPDLEAEPAAFPSDRGHRSYMTEIHTLAASGLAVLAYDNTGTMASEGRAHNVYQTKESETHLNTVMSAIGAAKRKYGKAGIPPEERERLYAIDYALITREDPAVMETVTAFIHRCMERKKAE